MRIASNILDSKWNLEPPNTISKGEKERREKKIEKKEKRREKNERIREKKREKKRKKCPGSIIINLHSIHKKKTKYIGRNA